MNDTKTRKLSLERGRSIGPWKGCEVTRGHHFDGEVEVTHFWICEVTQNRAPVFARSTPVWVRGHLVVICEAKLITTSISARSSRIHSYPSFLCVLFLLSWKFFSTTVKYWSGFYLKSFILLHFRAFKTKLFFNHGEVLKEILLKILHSGAIPSS